MSEQAIAQLLLKEYGRTFADEIGITVKDMPASLFQLLCAALLFSARIRASVAIKAAKALFNQGWTTPQKLAVSTWAERTQTLNRAGYARYDESTSRMLGDTTEMLLDRYKGDLRHLREEAGRDPEQERRLLKEFKGIGDTGVNIFFREVQGIWNELFPFADERTLESAQKLKLSDDPQKLVQLVGKRDFPRLVAALVRVQITGDLNELLAEAQQLEK